MDCRKHACENAGLSLVPVPISSVQGGNSALRSFRTVRLFFEPRQLQPHSDSPPGRFVSFISPHRTVQNTSAEHTVKLNADAVGKLLVYDFQIFQLILNYRFHWIFAVFLFFKQIAE